MDETQDNVIYIIDEDGTEKAYEILFTFEENQRFHKSYVLVYEAGKGDEEEVEIQAFSYHEDETGKGGDLDPIETEEEWEMVEEVLNTYQHDVLLSEDEDQ